MDGVSACERVEVMDEAETLRLYLPKYSDDVYS
jgi:hypothetical protein